jgi:outer membrane protein
MRFFLLILLFVLTGLVSVQAQKPKIGYTNLELVVSLMPEYKSMRSQIETHEQKLLQALEVKKIYLQQKFAEYQEKIKNPSLKADEKTEMEKDLQKLQEEIQKSSEDAEANLQKKKEDLLTPILDKLQGVIDEIYKAEGYDYIFNSGAGGNSIIIKGPDHDNITLKILGKLNIQPPQEILDLINGKKK